MPLPTTDRQKPHKQSRRTLIADAVIRVMGEKGIREVSHRKIDRFLNLPDGSTSPYYPKLLDLLKAGLERLGEHDAQARLNLHEAIEAKSSDGTLLDPSEVAAMLHDIWISANRPEYRHLLMARFEFFLLADRQPEFKDSNTRYFEELFEIDRLIFEKMGAAQPASAAREYGVFRRGLWFTLLIAPRSLTKDFSLAHFEAHIRRIIRETDG